MFVLLTYDISDTRRRKKIEKIVSSFGYRVNYSVFELNISKTKLNILLSQMYKVAIKEDNIRVYILDKDVVQKSFILNSKKKTFEDEELYF